MVEPSAAQRRRAQINIATVVVLLVLVVAVTYLALGRGTTTVDAPAVGKAEQSLVVGKPSAPHSVIVYEDFLCPFCGELEAQTHAALDEAAAAGTIVVDYRPFVLLDRLGDYSERATNAFAVVQAAAGDEVAVRFHNLLFAQQPDEKGPYPDDDQLVAWAVEAGATEADVRSGIEDLAQKSWVEAATSAASDAGVSATPTVILDGKVLEGTVQDRVDAIEQVIAGAGA